MPCGDVCIMLGLMIAFTLSGLASGERAVYRETEGLITCEGTRFCEGENFKCQDGKCVLDGVDDPEGYVFLGGMHVGSGKGQPTACVLNDPKVFNFGMEEGVNFPNPCPSLFSHVQTSFEEQPTGNGIQKANGKVDIKVWTLNTIIGGKQYVGETQVDIVISDITDSDTGVYLGEEKRTFVVSGNSIEDHGYEYKLLGFNNGQKITKNFDTAMSIFSYNRPTFELVGKNNRVHLVEPFTGTEMSFRPADASLSVFDQKWIPSVCITYRNTGKVEDVEFKSKYLVASLPPDQTFAADYGAADLDSKSQEVINRGFRSTPNKVKLGTDELTGACKALRLTMEFKKQRCKNKIPDCQIFLEKELFVNCHISKGGLEPNPRVKLAEFFHACLGSLCGDTDESDADTSNDRSTHCGNFQTFIDTMDDKCKQVPGIARAIARIGQQCVNP